MPDILANSPAEAWVMTTKLLLERPVRVGDLYEHLNVVIEIMPNPESEQDRIFDKCFRQIFGDERIDYAKSVTFIEPKIEGLLDRLKYRTVGKRWKDSYWGRMVAYDGHVNQVENALKLLSTHKNIKRCELIVYDPSIDMTNMYKQPCLLAVDLKPRRGALHLSAFFRSQRVSKSGYADYTALCEMMRWLAKESKLEQGHVVIHAVSCHITPEFQERKKSGQLLDMLEVEGYYGFARSTP